MEHRIFNTAFCDVYVLYIEKANKKGRSKDEVDSIICWLTGYDVNELQNIVDRRETFRDFFNNAPQISLKSVLVRGSICGVKIQEIEK